MRDSAGGYEMAKVLLVNPPERTELAMVMGINAPPLGLMHLAAYLEKHAIPVEILDANILGYGPRRIALEAKRSRVDIIGLTAATPAINSALAVMDAVRAMNPDVVGIIGGVHSTFMPGQVLDRCQAMDLVVRGEGEETLLELARTLDGFSWEGLGGRSRGSGRWRLFSGLVSKVAGIAYRSPDGTEVRLTPPRPLIKDLDALPFPARHLVPFGRYTIQGRETSIGSMVTSRGCPFACAYCSSSRILGTGFRCRSPANVAGEVTLLHEKYGLSEVELVDDIFTLNKKRARDFAAEMRQRRLDVRWVASSRVDTIDRGLMEDMRRGGLSKIYFGVESGSQRVLDLMNKRTTLEKARAAFKAAKGSMVKTIGSFMFGYPGETLAEMRQTIRFATELDPAYAQFTILTPYPGTPIYEKMKRAGLLLTEDWDQYTILKPVIKYEAFGYTAPLLRRMMASAYMKFYLRPSYIARHLHILPLILGTFMRGELPKMRFDPHESS
jgi:anaerobic magnesium-protoporphyrin IX monomethyl ester cyclase